MPQQRQRRLIMATGRWTSGWLLLLTQWSGCRWLESPQSFTLTHTRTHTRIPTCTYTRDSSRPSSSRLNNSRRLRLDSPCLVRPSPVKSPPKKNKPPNNSLSLSLREKKILYTIYLFFCFVYVTFFVVVIRETPKGTIRCVQLDCWTQRMDPFALTIL